MRPCRERAFMYICFIEVNMKQTKATPSEIDVKRQILIIQDKIDEELNKPECEIDMNIVDNYFKQIRELDGGVYEKSDEQIAKELENIYKKANKNKKKLLLWYLNTTKKQAVAILIAICIFLGLSVGVYAAREPIVEFFLNVKEKFSEVFFNQEDIEKAPKTIETVYTLGYVPEGYELSDRKIYNKNVKTIWKTSLGTEIIFDQSCINNSEKTIDNEDNDLEIFYIENTKIITYEKFDQRKLIWNNEKYIFSLTVPKKISSEEYKNIINSLKKFNQ